MTFNYQYLCDDNTIVADPSDTCDDGTTPDSYEVSTSTSNSCSPTSGGMNGQNGEGYTGEWGEPGGGGGGTGNGAGGGGGGIASYFPNGHGGAGGNGGGGGYAVMTYTASSCFLQ
jgi:hypothetical protein